MSKKVAPKTETPVESESEDMINLVKQMIENGFAYESDKHVLFDVTSYDPKELMDAINEAMRDWVANVETTYYLIGTAAGPHPYPEMVRDFQSVIGKEVRTQIQKAENRLPDLLVACIGGGSNALGLFHDFLDFD